MQHKHNIHMMYDIQCKVIYNKTVGQTSWQALWCHLVVILNNYNHELLAKAVHLNQTDIIINHYFPYCI